MLQRVVQFGHKEKLHLQDENCDEIEIPFARFPTIKANLHIALITSKEVIPEDFHITGWAWKVISHLKILELFIFKKFIGICLFLIVHVYFSFLFLQSFFWLLNLLIRALICFLISLFGLLFKLLFGTPLLFVILLVYFSKN